MRHTAPTRWSALGRSWPSLLVTAVGLLVWALDTRLANQLACPVPARQPVDA
ncbi:MAG: hypothetical protein ACO1PW_02030 [Actinomycetota bacterium]